MQRHHSGTVSLKPYMEMVHSICIINQCLILPTAAEICSQQGNHV
jgi:hypothetical protein